MRKVRDIKWGIPITVSLGLGFLAMMAGAGAGKTEEGPSMGMAGGSMKVTIEGKNIGLGWLSKMVLGYATAASIAGTSEEKVTEL